MARAASASSGLPRNVGPRLTDGDHGVGTEDGARRRLGTELASRAADLEGSQPAHVRQRLLA
jgi:hypothetical protein